MLESELYEHMTIAEEERPELAKQPALMLLWEFISVSERTPMTWGFIVWVNLLTLFSSCSLHKIRGHEVLVWELF
jgi:hypothetical protein